VKETAKNILKAIGLYHPLQGFYRSLLKRFTRPGIENNIKNTKARVIPAIIAMPPIQNSLPGAPLRKTGKLLKSIKP